MGVATESGKSKVFTATWAAEPRNHDGKHPNFGLLILLSSSHLPDFDCRWSKWCQMHPILSDFWCESADARVQAVFRPRGFSVTEACPKQFARWRIFPSKGHFTRNRELGLDLGYRFRNWHTIVHVQVTERKPKSWHPLRQEVGNCRNKLEDVFRFVPALQERRRRDMS